MKILLHLLLWVSCFLLIHGIIDGLAKNVNLWLISFYIMSLISGVLQLNKQFNEKSN